MFEEKLCNQVREDDYFDSFKDVNKVIDDIIKENNDGMEIIKSLISKYNAKTNNAEPLGVAAIMYTVALTTVNLLAEILSASDFISNGILIVVCTLATVILIGYYCKIKKATYKNIFVLECLKFKYDGLQKDDVKKEIQSFDEQKTSEVKGCEETEC